MCAVSNIGDNYSQRYQNHPLVQGPYVPQGPGLGSGGGMGQGSNQFTLTPQITREEFNSLKQEIQEMKQLLLKAKAEDIATGQKDCEMEEKVKVLRQVADLVGVDLNDVFPKKD